jgi:hypothetical protein
VGFQRIGSVAAACLALVLTDCSRGPRAPLNPPQLVTDSEADMAVQLFMQATILLATYYGYPTIDYEEIRSRSEKAGFRALPFMAPEFRRATPRFKKKTLVHSIQLVPRNVTGDPPTVTTMQRWIDDAGHDGYKTLVKYYVTTGWRAAQVICRNYLMRLDERNRYVEFLQSQFGIFGDLANGILMAVDANGTLRNALGISTAAVTRSIDTYQEYRFLNVNIDAARALVEVAQNKLAQHYFDLIDRSGGPGPDDDKNPLTKTNRKYGRFTFSDAVNAVSVIEQQCTRAGIRRLIDRAVYETPTNMIVDPTTGTIVFQSSAEAAKKANGAK